MKTLGIIGGTGPESTIEYYRLIIALYKQRITDGSYPSIIINSIDLKRMLDLIAANQLDEVASYLGSEVRKLASAGADFALLASNTPHIVFEAISAASPIPMVSIVEAACEAVNSARLKKVGLFGTRFTMGGRFYQDVFARKAISLVLPNEQEQELIHDKYMNELLSNQFLEPTRNRILAIVERMKNEEQIEAVILAGTELPLLLNCQSYAGIPLFDTTRIHVNLAVSILLS